MLRPSPFCGCGTITSITCEGAWTNISDYNAISVSLENRNLERQFYRVVLLGD